MHSNLHKVLLFTLLLQINMVLQCLIADLKLSCMYRVSTNWDRVCIDIHDTRYTKHDTRRFRVSCSEL